MSAPDAEKVITALGAVIDPTFERPMVEIGSIADVVVEGGTARLTARLSSPSDEVKEEARRRIEEAARGAGVEAVEIDWAVQVPTREVMGDDPIPSVRNVLLVMSGKGGVGKSTCAVNLAMALKRMGTRVGLLDADIYGPSIPTMMGIQGRPRSEDGKTIRPLERFGVKLMSIGFLVEDPKQAIVWRGPMLHGALQQFLADVAWGELDFLVIDLPPGTGDVALTMAQRLKVTGAVLVTTPQEVALQDVYKAVDMCARLHIPVLGVIENMSWFIDPAGIRHELFGSGGGAKVAELAKAPLLGQVPLEPAVREWGDDGTPIVQSAPGATASKAFMDAADQLVTRIAREHFERGGATQVPGAKGPKRLRILR
jgi:ATP-binding protein involved in chromosome partitioning